MIETLGGGLGEVSSPGLVCQGSTCRSLHTPGSSVAIEARTHNGDESYFQRWGGSCAGVRGRVCELAMDGPRAVTATFALQEANLVFTSSARVDGLQGGLAPYDGLCNGLAAAAGINNATRSGFVAWMSAGGQDARDRVRYELASARRGFVRMDGELFSATLYAPFTPFYYPAELDEQGAPADDAFVWTRTAPDGTAAPDTCADWTPTPGALGRLGSVSGGPAVWTDSGASAPCGEAHAIRCVGRKRDVSLPPLPGLPPDGRYAFVSAPVPSGTGTDGLDSACATDRFDGRRFRALVSTSTTPASARVDPNAAYHRPDGAYVGRGADLASGAPLVTGIWQDASGLYLGGSVRAWTGSAAPETTGTAETTCDDWSAPSGTSLTGRVGDARRYWDDGGAMVACDVSARVYCVEQPNP